MFDQAKMAAQAAKLQKQLKKEIVEVEAGDGAVVVRMNGKMEVKDVIINVDEIDGDNVKQVQELVKKATDQAIKKTQVVMAQKMQSMGGFNLPGM